MNDWPWIVALGLAGLSGGVLLAPRRNPAVWLVWLSLPFIGLLAILVIEAGLDGAAAPVGDKIAFGFVIYALLIAPPWLGGNLVGWALGRRRQGRRAAPMPPAASRAAPPARPDDGLPDWDRYDNPRTEPWQLTQRLRELALRGGLDPAALPAFGYPPDGTGDCFMEDKFGHLYLRLQEGRTVFEESSSNADRMCYEVLRRHAAERVEARLSGTDLAPEERAAVVRRETAAILEKIDPRWARLFLLPVRA